MSDDAPCIACPLLEKSPSVRGLTEEKGQEGTEDTTRYFRRDIFIFSHLSVFFSSRSLKLVSQNPSPLLPYISLTLLISCIYLSLSFPLQILSAMCLEMVLVREKERLIQPPTPVHTSPTLPCIPLILLITSLFPLPPFLPSVSLFPFLSISLSFV